MIRYPAVAGSFYPSDPVELRRTILSLLSKVPEAEEKEVVGAIVPHAGYVYSGWVAAYAYRTLEKTTHPHERVVVVGPNHTGYGAPVSVFPRGEWVTPLGPVAVDEEIAKQIVERSSAEFDTDAHIFEHSVEVQLPFLQTIYPSFSFVPIVMLDQSYDAAKELAEALPPDVVLIASSDFSHYVPADVAKRLDMLVIEKIRALDAQGIERVVREHRISVCGYGPIMTLVEWAKAQNARAEVLKYATSGDVTGDYSNVVAYAAIVFVR